MADIARLANIAVDEQANVLGLMCDGGSIVFYSGPRPMSSDEPVTSQVAGVTLHFGTPAFGQAVGGVITAEPIVPGVVVASIFAEWARIYGADGLAVMDVDVAVADASITLPTQSLVAGMEVGVSSYTHTVPKSGGSATHLKMQVTP